ncbi:MAG: permease [Actinobacteria bacterium]|nr:permease [Actinomycetota bacterium]
MDSARTTGPNWSRRLLFAGIVVALVLGGGLIASATIPRWWAQRIGDQVEGSLVTGTFVGLFYGFVFTALPLLALAAVARWRRTPRAIAVAVGFAVILAIPNLMTLGIVLGTGNAAHAGERILDVEAPAFRGASLVGALIALAMAGFVSYLIVSRERARKRTGEMP